MKKENQIILTVGLMLIAYGIGNLNGREYMFRIYGQVMSSEMLEYLARKDSDV